MANPEWTEPDAFNDEEVRMTNKTPSAIDLVPCPFCGSEPKFNTHFAWCSNGHMMVQLPLGSWNTRPEAADTITRLQAALEHIAEEGDAETSASVQLEGCKQIAREALSSVGGE